MIALLLSLGASLAWGVSDFGGGTAARRRSTLDVLLLMRVGGLLIVVLIALATTAAPVGSRWPFAVAAGIATLFGGLALLRALAIGPMGITAPIAAAGAAIPAIVGLFTGTAPGTATLAGLVVAAVGALLASRARGHGGERVNAAGLASALAASVLLGLALLLIHEASKESGVAAVLVQRVTEVAVLLLGAIVVRARRVAGRAGLLRAEGTPAIVGIGVIEGLAVTAFAVASTLGSLTLVAVMSSLYPVVTALLARALHDEQLSRSQMLGSALTLTGVAIVAATSV